MKKLAFLSVVCFTLAAFSARASEARSGALLYNLAFEDQTDIFIFPNLLPAYQGLYFYLPSTNNNMYGGMIYNLGPDSALGVFVHRPLNNAFDQYRMSPTDVPQEMGFFFDTANPLQQHLPGQIVDLMYGTGKWGAALRFHLWSEVSEQEPPLADPAESNTAISTELDVGFNLFDGLNLLGSVGFRNLTDNSTNLLFKAGGRYISPDKKRLRPVVATELQFGLSIPENGDSSFAFMLPLLAGGRLAAIEEVMYIGMLGGLEIQMYVPGGGDTQFALVAPTLQASVEWQALKWLLVRAGLKGAYGVLFAGDTNDNMPKHEQMSFSSGVGIPLGPFTIDGIISYSLWNNGPYLIGGLPGLFAGVSLSYNWGGDSGVSTPAPSHPKTAPAVVPESKPAEEKAPATSTEEKKPEFEGW